MLFLFKGGGEGGGGGRGNEEVFFRALLCSVADAALFMLRLNVSSIGLTHSDLVGGAPFACSHTVSVSLCVWNCSHNKQRLKPRAALTDWSRQWLQTVLCAVRTEYLYKMQFYNLHVTHSTLLFDLFASGHVFCWMYQHSPRIAHWGPKHVAVFQCEWSGVNIYSALVGFFTQNKKKTD